MTDVIDRIRAEMSTRLTELRPLVEEHKRLDAALRALADVETNVPTPAATSSSGANTRPRRNARQRTPAKPRTRAPRGANREAVLRAVEGRPGATRAELAVVSGVERNTLYTLVARLVKEGELEKRELPSGRAGYALGRTRPGEPGAGRRPATSAPTRAARRRRPAPPSRGGKG